LPALKLPPGVLTETPPLPLLLIFTAFETRQIPNMMAQTERIPSPTKTPTIIRMIFSALFPLLAGVAVAGT
jgi:hypothetical protein